MGNAIQERPVPSELRTTESSLMIKSVTIENFRCFKKAEAKNLGLVNVIVGDMGAGKSAFLEALFLLATNTPAAHEIFFRLRGRGQFVGGVMQLKFDIDELLNGQYWSDLFYGYNNSNPVRIESSGDRERKLHVTASDSQTGVIQPDSWVPAPISFEWWDGDEYSISVPEISEGQIRFNTVGKHIEGIMLTLTPPGDVEVAKWFDKLQNDGTARVVVKALQAWFPEVDNLRLGLDGSRHVLFVVPRVGPHFPLSMLSYGLNKMVSVMCAIAQYPGGAIFLDEVGAGIYHTRLESWWRELHRMAAKDQTQLFVTTHSQEVLDALLPTISKNEKDFRMIYVTRNHKDRNSSLKVVSGKGFASALAENIEVR